jgi:dTDP-4-dehydrorhamnose 3,5-epimerase
MRFSQTEIPGLLIVETVRHADDRGYFARTFDAAAFRAAGLVDRWPQCSVSHNLRRGTLRGLHWQAEPAAETKLVRCARGRIFDVAVDLRPRSPTFRRWFGLDLGPDKQRALYIPPGLAHGFVTLADDSDVFYQIDVEHAPELARGARWNDPAFAIAWPIAPQVMSERDAAYPDFAP